MRTRLIAVFLIFSSVIFAQVQQPFSAVWFSQGETLRLKSGAMEAIQDHEGILSIELSLLGEKKVVELYEVDALTDDFYAVDSKDNFHELEQRKHYAGHIKGDSDSYVSLATQKDCIVFLVHDGTDSYVIAPADEKEPGTRYKCIKESKKQPSFFLDNDGIEINAGVQQSPDSYQSNSCKQVEFYVELDYDMFQKNGSSLQSTLDKFAAMFANVAELYRRDGIFVKLKKVKIWDSQDPYAIESTKGSLAVLTKFRSQMAGNFDGDLAHLMSTLPRGNGGVAYVGVLCVKSYGVAYSNIQNSFSDYPTYSWSIEVMTHEWGHNLGSPHTQSCTWPNGAIDGCYAPEGSCARGPIPSGGGTIMSYCHLTTTGINFTKGFGAQPKALIQSKIASASCLKSCDDNGGDDDGDEEIVDLVAVSGVLQVTDTHIKTNFEIKSNGALSSPFRVAWRISDKAVNYNDSNPLFAVESLQGIAKDQRKVFNISKLKSELGLPKGRYYIAAKIDVDNTVVESNESNNVFFFSRSFDIDDDDQGLGYCESKAEDTNYEYISKVTIGDFVNPSASDNYKYYKGSDIGLETGKEKDWSVDVTYNAGASPENIAIWVDYDQNGTFEISERVGLKKGFRDKTNGTFVVPNSAKKGKTRMRVRLEWGDRVMMDNACGVFTYGEVEDYDVLISESVTPCSVPEFGTVCYKSDTSVVIDWMHEPFPESPAFEFRYRKERGAWVSKTVNQSVITLSNLDAESFYDYEVRALNEKDTACSDWTKTHIFDTKILCFDAEEK